MPAITGYHEEAAKIIPKALFDESISFEVRIGKYGGDGANSEILEEDVSWLITFPIEHDWILYNTGSQDVCENFLGTGSLFGGNFLYNRGTYIHNVSSDIEFDTLGVYCNGTLFYSSAFQNGQVIRTDELQNGISVAVCIFKQGDVVVCNNISVTCSQLNYRYRMCHQTDGLGALLCSTECYDTLVGKKLENMFGLDSTTNDGDWTIKWFNSDYEEILSVDVSMVEWTDENTGLPYYTNDEKITFDPPTYSYTAFGSATSFSACYLFKGNQIVTQLENCSTPANPSVVNKFFTSSSVNGCKRIYFKGRFTVGFTGTI